MLTGCLHFVVVLLAFCAIDALVFLATPTVWELNIFWFDSLHSTEKIGDQGHPTKFQVKSNVHTS
jgi:hypothetical protein